MKSWRKLTRIPQLNDVYVFMAIYAVFKLEYLKIKHKLNHFALKAKLLLKATRQPYEELQVLRGSA